MGSPSAAESAGTAGQTVSDSGRRTQQAECEASPAKQAGDRHALRAGEDEHQLGIPLLSKVVPQVARKPGSGESDNRERDAG